MSRVSETILDAIALEFCLKRSALNKQNYSALRFRILASVLYSNFAQSNP